METYFVLNMQEDAIIIFYEEPEISLDQIGYVGSSEDLRGQEQFCLNQWRQDPLWLVQSGMLQICSKTGRHCQENRAKICRKY